MFCARAFDNELDVVKFEHDLFRALFKSYCTKIVIFSEEFFPLLFHIYSFVEY